MIKEIKPNFDGLQNPETIIQEVESLTSINIKNHSAILDELLNQFKPIDFQELAFPESIEIKERLKKLKAKQDKNPEDEAIKKQIFDELKSLGKCKPKQKHYLILSIENLRSVSIQNDWGLVKNKDFIYLYNGSYWKQLDNDTFKKFLGESAEKMGVPEYDAKHYKFRDELLKQFLATEYLPTPEVNPKQVLINLENGTFEISPKKQYLRGFASEDFMTYKLPFEYNPESKAPLFLKYLDEVLPDKKLQNILAEYLGYVFIRNGANYLKLEKALFLYGGGANGKSVFFDIVKAILGNENTSEYTLQSLTDDKGYQRAKISDKLVNYCSDISNKLESGMFKQLVSGEPLEARLPYGQPFIMNQYAKLIFNTNELPKDVEHTNAYFRRFLIIPFDVTIPEDKQDKELSQKIISSELSGVFNWILEGLNRVLQNKKLTHSNKVKNIVDQYRKESDSVQMFIEESNYKTDVVIYKLIKDIYPEYRAYCMEDGSSPVKKSNFIKRLKALNLVVDRVTGNQLAVYVKK